MSIKSKLRVLAVSGIAAGAIAGSVALAGGASAATTNVPAPHLPAACQTHVRGSDNLQLTFDNQTFRYQVRLRLSPVFFQRGVLVVSGTLCDTNEPVPLVLPVHGVIFGHGIAILSVVYPTVGPDAGNQGVRTFSGVIGPHGSVAGTWSETGTEAGSGPFTLQRI
jgi:hypothetical protein